MFRFSSIYKRIFEEKKENSCWAKKQLQSEETVAVLRFMIVKILSLFFYFSNINKSYHGAHPDDLPNLRFCNDDSFRRHASIAYLTGCQSRTWNWQFCLESYRQVFLFHFLVDSISQTMWFCSHHRISFQNISRSNHGAHLDDLTHWHFGDDGRFGQRVFISSFSGG